MTDETPHARPDAGMPNWLFYGLIAKLVLVVVVTTAVLFYAGIL